MKSHEILREVLQKHGVKQVADKMGLSQSLVYKWGQSSAETGSGSLNPLDRMEALVACTGENDLVQWICQKAGGFFVKNSSKNGSGHTHLVPATNEIVQEFADLLSVISRAAVDGQISREEAGNIRGRWEELKTVTETFVNNCEQANFTSLKERLNLGERSGSGSGR